LFTVFGKRCFAWVRLKNVSGYGYRVVWVTAYGDAALDEQLVTNLGYFWSVLNDAQLRVKR
jgi:hypothetical protein